MKPANSLPHVTLYDYPLEKALDLTEEMTDVQRNNRPNLTVYSGIHPTLGAVYIILPPLGNPIVLPLFLQYPDPDLDTLKETIETPLLTRDP